MLDNFMPLMLHSSSSTDPVEPAPAKTTPGKTTGIRGNEGHNLNFRSRIWNFQSPITNPVEPAPVKTTPAKTTGIRGDEGHTRNFGSRKTNPVEPAPDNSTSDKTTGIRGDEERNRNYGSRRNFGSRTWYFGRVNRNLGGPNPNTGRT